MANVWFTSDLHLGHRNICKFRTYFSSPEEHHEVITDNLASSVKKNDLLWILGDSVFDTDYLGHLDRIRCQKHLVIGNHCAERYDQKLLYAKFNKVYGLKKKYGAWLTHAPIHPEELRGNWCIHGHTHNHLIKKVIHLGEQYVRYDVDERYINVCPEHHDWKPVDLAWVKNEMEVRSAS